MRIKYIISFLILLLFNISCIQTKNNDEIEKEKFIDKKMGFENNNLKYLDDRKILKNNDFYYLNENISEYNYLIKKYKKYKNLSMDKINKQYLLFQEKYGNMKWSEKIDNIINMRKYSEYILISEVFYAMRLFYDYENIKKNYENLNLTQIPLHLRKPKDLILQNNESVIWFDPNNSDDFTSFDDFYEIKGAVIPNSIKLEVYYKMKLIKTFYFNQKIEPNCFNIIVSKKDSTANDYLNTYKFKCYRKENEFYTSEFELLLIPKTSKIIDNKTLDWFYYEKESLKKYDLYKIRIYYSNKLGYINDFNKYKILLRDNSYILFYLIDNFENLFLEYNLNNKIKTVKISPAFITSFEGMFIYLKHYNNGDFLLETSYGHEGHPDYVYFNNKIKKLIKISDLIRKYKDPKKYLFPLFANLNNDVLEVYKYQSPFDPDGYEVIYYFNSDLNLIKIKKGSESEPIIQNRKLYGKFLDY